MSALKTIREKLKQFPELQVDDLHNSITVSPQNSNGFEVSIKVNNDSYTVFLGGWHSHFTSDNEAVNCFALGLSKECRLKVTSAGDFAYRWQVEYSQSSNWHDPTTIEVGEEVVLFLFPFWRKRTIQYLQNSVF